MSQSILGYSALQRKRSVNKVQYKRRAGDPRLEKVAKSHHDTSEIRWFFVVETWTRTGIKTPDSL